MTVYGGLLALLVQAAEPEPDLRFGKIHLSSVPPTSATPEKGAAPGDAPGGFAAALAAVQSAMAASETVEVFEGLPHPLEKESLAREKQKPTRTLNMELFYADPRPVSAEMRREIESLVGGPALAPFRGIKLCGPFHADYAVRWTWNKGESSTLLLLCFGCAEARVVAGGRWTTDLARGEFEKLKTLFAAFRNQRPERAFPTAAATKPR